MDTIFFNALAEPNRFRIVELLRARPLSVNQIVQQLNLKQPLVSKHLRTLNQAGLVTARPRAQQRIYMLQDRPLKELSAWLDTFSLMWEDRLDAFDSYAANQQREVKGHDYNV